MVADRVILERAVCLIYCAIQLNLLKATIHSGEMEIAIDRWLLIAECK